MRAAEKVELGLIPPTVAAVGLAAPLLPARLATGELLAVACLALLAQGGLRDLWLLFMAAPPSRAAPRRELACMCLESSVGLTGILLGVALTFFDLGGFVLLDAWRWMFLAAGVLTLGFFGREFVISWRPPGLRRLRDHHTIVFRLW